jgi:hypothetical protein
MGNKEYTESAGGVNASSEVQLGVDDAKSNTGARNDSGLSRRTPMWWLWQEIPETSLWANQWRTFLFCFLRKSYQGETGFNATGAENVWYPFVVE